MTDTAARKRNHYRTSNVVLRPHDDYVPDGLDPDKTITPAAAKDFRAQRASIVRSAKCRPGDPVSVLFVLDLVLRAHPDTRIRAKELVNLLRMYYPQVLWDVRTVGRILAGLVEAASGCGAPERDLPIKSYVSGGTAGYVVSTRLESWRWLISARHALGNIAEQMVEQERAMGREEPFGDFPWAAFEHKWG